MLCPFCSEVIVEGAIKCKHCGEILDKERHAELIGVQTPKVNSSDSIQLADSNAIVPSSGKSITQMIGGLVSLAFIAYAIWSFAPFLPIVGPLVSKATQPSNILEEVVQIGKSNQADFKRLVDAGGLNKFQAWHGLYAKDVSTVYGSNGTLKTMQIRIGGTSEWWQSLGKWTIKETSVAPVEVRKTLTDVCKISNWTVSDSGGYGERMAPELGGVLKCVYNMWSDNSSDFIVVVGLEREAEPIKRQSITSSAPETQITHPTSLPKFQKGEDYGAVRMKLLANGWLPFHAKYADTCNKGDERCEGRPEMASCSGSGLANCQFLWTRGDEKLAICTIGEERGIFDQICNFPQ